VKVSSAYGMIANRLRRHDVYSKAEYWDKKAEELDGHSISMWPNNHLNELYHHEQTAVIDRVLPDVAGRRALDVGCGTGRMTRYLASRGAIVKGIDFASRAIEIAKHAGGSAGNPTYVVQSIFDLDDREQYDVVLSWGSVAIASRNVVELRDALGRLYRSLRPGGEILLLEPIHRGFLHRVLNLHVDEFASEMTAARFDVVEVTDMHFWPARMVLGYFQVPRPITQAVYHAGQRLMTRAFPRMGDYKAIHAVRR
jgi:2-polyprenyl-3-methyl-5-hydroxy-6-metoxy-1,4-benzoquinol methylase